MEPRCLVDKNESGVKERRGLRERCSFLQAETCSRSAGWGEEKATDRGGNWQAAAPSVRGRHEHSTTCARPSKSGRCPPPHSE